MKVTRDGHPDVELTKANTAYVFRDGPAPDAVTQEIEGRRYIWITARELLSPEGIGAPCMSRASPGLQVHRGNCMGKVEERIKALGLVLPEPLQAPPGVVLPFQFVRVSGTRALISGHGPTNADGSVATPLGKVGREVSLEQAYASAQLTAMAILGSLKRALGDLDRINAWIRVFGMVNSAPGFNRQPHVINGFSDLILEVFGPTAGAHCRSAVGMAELPFDIPVEIEGELKLAA
jgi:hypothetical protein